MTSPRQVAISRVVCDVSRLTEVICTLRQSRFMEIHSGLALYPKQNRCHPGVIVMFGLESCPYFLAAHEVRDVVGEDQKEAAPSVTLT